jgi:hypothetical protein
VSIKVAMELDFECVDVGQYYTFDVNTASGKALFGFSTTWNSYYEEIHAITKKPISDRLG